LGSRGAPPLQGDQPLVSRGGAISAAVGAVPFFLSDTLVPIIVNTPIA